MFDFASTKMEFKGYPAISSSWKLNVCRAKDVVPPDGVYLDPGNEFDRSQTTCKNQLHTVQYERIIRFTFRWTYVTG